MFVKINKVVRFNPRTFQNEPVFSVCVYSGNITGALGEPIGTPRNRYNSLLRCIDCPEGLKQAQRVANEINGVTA